MAKLLLGFRIKSIPEQVSVYSSPQRSVDERYLLCVGIVEESKNMEGEGWGRFSGAAVPWAYCTIGPKGTWLERDGSYPRTFTTTRHLLKLGKLLQWLWHRQSRQRNLSVKKKEKFYDEVVCEGSNSGYVIKPKNPCKTTSRHRNTVEYIAGKSFLFILLKE